MNRDRVLTEIQSCFMALLNAVALDSAVLRGCRIEPGYNHKNIQDHVEHPVIYVNTPVLNGQENYLGCEPLLLFELTIGVWNDPASGGIDEHQVILSELLSCFTNPFDLHTRTFNVELKGVLHSAQTLTTHGIQIKGSEGPVCEHNANRDMIHSKFRIELNVRQGE